MVCHVTVFTRAGEEDLLLPGVVDKAERQMGMYGEYRHRQNRDQRHRQRVCKLWQRSTA